MQGLAKKAVKGLKWSAVERFLTQIIQLLIMIVLARLLGPKSYGLIGMLTIFIAISNVFVDSGFSAALIRKKNADNLDYSTVYVFNILVSVIIYLILFLLADKISLFYNEPELSLLIKIIALPIVVNSLSLIHKTKTIVEMNFKLQAKISFFSALFSGLIAILLATNGFGTLSLALQVLTQSILNTTFFYVYYPLKIKPKFSLTRFRSLFGFGSKLLLSSLLDTVYNNIYLVLIGKYFDPSTLGRFTQSKQLSMLPATTLSTVIQNVTYPMLSSIENSNSNYTDEALQSTIQLACMVVFPIMVGIAVISEPLISILLSEEWKEIPVYISILCIAYMVYPLHAINLNLLKVKGRSDLFLKLEVIKKVIMTIIIVISFKYGLTAICIGIAIQMYLCLIINTYYTGKLSRVNTIKQIKIVFPIYFSVIFSAFIGYFLSMSIESDLIRIFTCLTISLFLYALCIFNFQRALFYKIYNFFEFRFINEKYKC
ncbi:flippase [Photobacterium sanctipauli]|uniref:Flippase n=3 Tax=Photobacterium sanctipauli TaxID=1342794 RepID=A0A2T3NT85_9GAMM|nr:lipopolysaccharide biosynthesis protein [Photobacterium sanctipauli]PSW19493.1 flippase [Photobacterium sanctipauli]